jgi:2'-5' RNA ligase
MKIERLQNELATVAADTAPFELEAAGVGGFPDLKQPRVLWVGLRSEALIEVAQRVDEAAARCSFEREQRAFNPHLTIARLKRPQLHPAMRSSLESMREQSFGRSTIRETTLYRSITLPAGPVYAALRTFEFRP